MTLAEAAAALADAADHCRNCRDCGDGPCCDECRVHEMSETVGQLVASTLAPPTSQHLVFTDEEMTVIACAVDKHRQYLHGLLGITNTETHAAIMEKIRRHYAPRSSLLDKRCPAGFFCVHDVLCPGARR